jgi:glycosyltransferase involved in cell wall biosynthesis
MKEAKQLLLCTYYWPPSGGAGVQRSLKFTKYLPIFEVEPTILTVDELFATYPIIDKSLNLEVAENLNVIKTKSKEPFLLYKKISGSKEIPRSGFANSAKPKLSEKIMRFIRGNFFLPDARKGWNKYACKAAGSLIETDKIDAILTSSPPHSTQLIGLKLKKKYGLPWIADMRDPWTDIYYYHELFPSWIAKKIDASYEKKVLENADRVLVVSESIKKLFLQKSKKINPEKFVVIPNGFDSNDFELKNIPENDVFTVSYTGTISSLYDITSFASACKTAFLDKGRNLKLRFIGSSEAVLYPVLNKFGLLNFSEIIPPVDHKSSINYLLNSDVLLLLIPDNKNNEGILTGKLFEYLGSGKQIIGIGPENGDAAEIIKKCHAGKMFTYGANQELSEFLDKMYIFWEEGRMPVMNENVLYYSRKMQSQHLAHIIHSLV